VCVQGVDKHRGLRRGDEQDCALVRVQGVAGHRGLQHTPHLSEPEHTPTCSSKKLTSRPPELAGDQPAAPAHSDPRPAGQLLGPRVGEHCAPGVPISHICTQRPPEQGCALLRVRCRGTHRRGFRTRRAAMRAVEAEAAEAVRLRVAARRGLRMRQARLAGGSAERVRVLVRRTLHARPAVRAEEAQAAQTVRLRVAARRRLGVRAGRPLNSRDTTCTRPCPACLRTRSPDTPCRARRGARRSRGCTGSLSARRCVAGPRSSRGTQCTRPCPARPRTRSPGTPRTARRAGRRSQDRIDSLSACRCVAGPRNARGTSCTPSSPARWRTGSPGSGACQVGHICLKGSEECTWAQAN
jgi:hypothetical protein